MGKESGAFLTIGELAGQLALPQHILRYWETRFPQLRPLQRAGNRRYYRPDDVALVRRIHELLNVRGYTVRGAQQALSAKGEAAEAGEVVKAPPLSPSLDANAQDALLAGLQRVRAHLLDALDL
jgi:DNA-binding transcriptional MerR regulator